MADRCWGIGKHCCDRQAVIFFYVVRENFYLPSGRTFITVLRRFSAALLHSGGDSKMRRTLRLNTT